jgi:hypothetical protein
MTPRVARADAAATGSVIPSAADFVAGIATVQGVVTQLRVDLKDRFDKLDEKVDGVCSDVDRLKTDAAVNAALAKQATDLAKTTAAANVRLAESHVLAYRWRVGIAIGAAGGLGGLCIGVFRLLIGH